LQPFRRFQPLRIDPARRDALGGANQDNIEKSAGENGKIRFIEERFLLLFTKMLNYKS